MLFSRGLSRISRIPRNSSPCRWFLSHRSDTRPALIPNVPSLHPSESDRQALGCREIMYLASPTFHGLGRQMHHQSSSVLEEQLDPFSLVADELSLLANRLRAMVVAEVPKLASAAEYFFKLGVEGKRFRPTVLLLMATALNVSIPKPLPHLVGDNLTMDLRTRQQCVAEITEMIHELWGGDFGTASLLTTFGGAG